MKKIKTNFMLSLIALACMLNSTKMNAQFQSASIGENNVGSTPTARATGNDITDWHGNTYAVSVWDNAGTNPGLSWEVNNGATSYTPLFYTTGIFTVDVCLIHDDSYLFAILAYYVYGTQNKYYWEVYTWNGSAFSYTSTASFSSASFGSTLNIDGNDNGDFAIVWDNLTPQVKIITGSLVSSVPTLNTTVTIANSGYSPDLSLFHDNSSNIVHVAYLDVNGNLTIDDHSFSTLASGANSPSNVLSPVSPIYTFYHPRVASPSASVGASTDWTVVVDDNNSTSDWLIEGYNSSTTTTPIYYNDGSQSPSAHLNLATNYMPVVTYDDQNNVWVGWTFDNSGGYYDFGVNVSYSNVLDDAAYPVVLKCSFQAVPVSDYWIVPTSCNNNDYINVVSVAGRYSSNVLYLAYNNVGTPDIWTKWATSVNSLTQLRTSANLNTQSSDFLSDLNISKIGDQQFSLKLIDISGKTVFNLNANGKEIFRTLKNISDKISDGIYLAQIISNDGNKYYPASYF